MNLNESESLSIVNKFCVNLEKLKNLVEKEGKGSDEWKFIINEMRNQYRNMFWKHQKHLEKWRDLITELGFYDEDANYKIDVSDADSENEVQVEGNFNFATKVISDKGNVGYQYNEWSIPRDDLPENIRKEIYDKSIRNAEATSQGIAGNIQGNGRSYHRGGSPSTWGLPESERDWS